MTTHKQNIDYIYTLLKEKEIDLETSIDFTLQGQFHIMDVNHVITAIEDMDLDIVQSIVKQLTKIDFVDGDIIRFIKYIAKGIIIHQQ